MPTTITISYAEAMQISEPKEMHRALTKANNEGRHIGLTFDSDVKTAMLEISDTDGRVYITECMPWSRAKPAIRAWAERIASYDEDEPGEGHPIDRLFPVMFNEAQKDGLDKAVMLLLCARCDMGAEDIAALNILDLEKRQDKNIFIEHSNGMRYVLHDDDDILMEHLFSLTGRGFRRRDTPLFFNDHGDRITPEEVTAAFAGYALKAGVTATVDDIRAYGRKGGTLYLITLRGPCKEDYQVARLIRARHDFNFNAAIEEFCSSTGTECANGFFSTYDDCEKFLKWLEENGIRPVACEELELHYRSFDD